MGGKEERKDGAGGSSNRSAGVGRQSDGRRVGGGGGGLGGGRTARPRLLLRDNDPRAQITASPVSCLVIGGAGWVGGWGGLMGMGEERCDGRGRGWGADRCGREGAVSLHG